MKRLVYSIVMICVIVPVLLYAQSAIKMGGASNPTVNREYWGGIDQNGIARALLGVDSSGRVSLDPDARGAIFAGALTVTGAQTFTGAGTFSGNLVVNGNSTFGDASADTVTANAATWTFANDTAVTLSGGTDGLNFDANTLSIDATNNYVGFGTAAPSSAVDVVGTLSLTQGTQAASANSLNLAETTGNVFEITGTTVINQIDTTGYKNGSAIYLLFAAADTIAHNQTPTGTTASIQLSSAGTYTARANDVVTLVLTTSATTRAWRMLGGAW